MVCGLNSEPHTSSYPNTERGSQPPSCSISLAFGELAGIGMQTILSREGSLVSCECICSLIVPEPKTSDGVAQTYTTPWADSAQDRSRNVDPAHVTYCQRYYGARGIWASCSEVGVEYTFFFVLEVILTIPSLLA
jgi:hypothetical protein